MCVYARCIRRGIRSRHDSPEWRERDIVEPASVRAWERVDTLVSVFHFYDGQECIGVLVGGRPQPMSR